MRPAPEGFGRRFIIRGEWLALPEPVEVMHWAVAAADRVGAAQGFRQVLLRAAHRLGERIPAGEVGGDGGGEGAAGAVRGGSLYSRR